MQTVVKRTYYPSRGAEFKLTHLTDLHYGAASCQEQSIDKMIKLILSEENHYVTLGGDYGEFINRSDKRFRQSQLAPWLQGRIDDIAGAQVEYIVEKLMPLAKAGRILAIANGNHDDFILKRYERDVYREIVTKLKQDPEDRLAVGYQGFLMWSLCRKSKGSGTRTKDYSSDTFPIRIYINHGYGGGRLMGSHALSLERLSMAYDFDIAFMGHRHVLHSVRKIKVTVGSNGKVYTRPVIACFSGGFKFSLSDDPDSDSDTSQYEEQAGYPPSPIACYTIVIRPADRAMRIQENVFDSGNLYSIGGVF